jgi:hypothetical protein
VGIGVLVAEEAGEAIIVEVGIGLDVAVGCGCGAVPHAVKSKEKISKQKMVVEDRRFMSCLTVCLNPSGF